MGQSFSVSRRGFLAGACCLAAAPVFTPVSFAAMPGERRFVAIVLRGAMDGLDLVQPYGDKGFAAMRPTLALTPDRGLVDLDGYFGLHPDAVDLMPLWRSGELAFAHAVSTPYRDGRSHFDGQDILEAGTAGADGTRTGWLNRALSAMDRSQSTRAIDVNTTMELILSGPNPVDAWAETSSVALSSDMLGFMRKLYAEDADFSRVFAEAVRADGDSDRLLGTRKRRQSMGDMARFTAGMLNGDYRIAAFSIDGWDTHAAQAGVFSKAANDLVTVLLGLRTELGANWKNTVVLAMTEFGRTARENGSQGTDHGTGGVALVAGGDIAGGKVIGQWPGIAEDQLFENRDLFPTRDVRALAAALLKRQFGLGAEALTGKVFPGLDLGNSQAFLKI